jgi:acetoin utilization deacetylase AcuC-like enzyme
MAIEFPGHTSQSTYKSKIFTSNLLQIGNYEIVNFKPLEEEDFLLAHTKNYVNDFFKGIAPKCHTSGFKWSLEYAESIKYTVASLYESIQEAILSKSLTIAPVSGFHHAKPNKGQDFCAMSGQVIASLKIYQKYALKAAYIDLDAHYGNSIENTYKFNKDLIKAIPKGYNVNVAGDNYLEKLEKALNNIKDVDYIVLCHGADLVEGDILGGFQSKEIWLEAAKMVVDKFKGLPMVYCLFGGYRDNFQDVINLHLEGIELVKECYNKII